MRLNFSIGLDDSSKESWLTLFFPLPFRPFDCQETVLSVNPTTTVYRTNNWLCKKIKKFESFTCFRQKLSCVYFSPLYFHFSLQQIPFLIGYKTLFHFLLGDYLLYYLYFSPCRFEGLRGFYRGITPNLLKNVPASSITFIVYENVLNFLKKARKTNWHFVSSPFFTFPSMALICVFSCASFIFFVVATVNNDFIIL